jgi:hypothetical protein
LNVEFLAVIHSRALAEALPAVVQSEVEQSQRITLSEGNGRTWWQRLVAAAALPLADADGIGYFQ